MDCLDISNNTTRFTVQNVQNWVSEGINLANIQLLSGVRCAGDDCATQIDICLQGGMAVDCYLFPGNDGLLLSTTQRLALVPPSARVAIRQLWVDVEPAYTNSTRGAVSVAMATCDMWAPWQTCGTYSALWVAVKYGWLPWPWPNQKQWLVNATGVPNLYGSFSGTNNHVMTQYAEDVVVDGISGMDRSLLSDSEAQAVWQWLGGPMAIVLGDGLAAQVSAAGDQPLCDHVFYKQTDDDGKEFDVEKVLGSKGLYVASNSSGTWVSAGPIAAV